ncbi:hypothetical protein [Parasitella parasitica]|uniref:Uncharacterized protein n=1 Tax=Parasitella parasitica TaxID=35722 RepID=A0A0B7N2S8_9FUNG|nr:hypothetical protein [Parasitella parasitica]
MFSVLAANVVSIGEDKSLEALGQVLFQVTVDLAHHSLKACAPTCGKLATAVQAQFDTYQDSKCAISGLPLFDKRCKKVASNVLETIKKGHVSDPPGVAWYYHMYIDRLGFPVYRCTRGFIEGGVHQNNVRKFASFNASPALTDCALADYRLRHNIQVGSKNMYRITYRSHFSPWIQQAINFMRCKIGQPVLRSYSDPSEKLDVCGNPSITITPEVDSVFGNMQYNYVSYMQGTKYAVTPVHTDEEIKLYDKFRLTDSLASGINQPDYWQKFATAWSKALNESMLRKNVFYKTAESLLLKQHFNKTEDKSKNYNSLRMNEEKVNAADEILNNNSRKRKHTNDILTANNYLCNFQESTLNPFTLFSPLTAISYQSYPYLKYSP